LPPSKVLTMPIIYSLVANGSGVVLCEAAGESKGNFQTVTAQLLKKLPASSSEGKNSVRYDNYQYLYIFEQNLVYLAMCVVDDRQRIPFAFLEDIKTTFRSKYGMRDLSNANAYSLDKDFSKILKTQMTYFNSPSADSFASVTSKLHDTKAIMVNNIEAILARGEKLDILVERTEVLSESSSQFAKSSRKLRDAMWWRRVKMYMLIFVIFALCLWLLTSFICGFDYKKC